MFSSNKCITLYSIILLHVVTRAFGIGMQLDGDWTAVGDPKTTKVNELLNTHCKNVLDESITHLSGVPLNLPFNVVSMAYLTPKVAKDKDERMGVVVVQDSTKPQGNGHEGYFFTIVLDYLNLYGDKVNDKDRMNLASNPPPCGAVSSTLQIAKDRVVTSVGAVEVIEMARPLGRAATKRFNQIKGFFGKSATSASGEASSRLKEKNSTQQTQLQDEPISISESAPYNSKSVV